LENFGKDVVEAWLVAEYKGDQMARITAMAKRFNSVLAKAGGIRYYSQTVNSNGYAGALASYIELRRNFWTHKVLNAPGWANGGVILHKNVAPIITKNHQRYMIF